MSQVLEFQNEKISVSVAQNPGCKVVMDMSVAPNLAKEAFDKAFKTIKKTVSVPGFRKGKAPDSMIKESYSKYIESEWRDNLSELALKEALELSDIHPYDRRKKVEIKISEASLDAPSKIQASFEVYPEVPTVDVEELEYEEIAPSQVTEEDIDRRIQGLLLFYADWSDVEDRGAQEGDYIDLDIVSAQNPSLQFCQNQRFVMEEKMMPKWIHKLLLGLNVGDVVEAESEKDDSMPEGVEFKPMLCKITVRGIKNADLPQLDDAFAEKVGAKSVQDLKEKVKEELESAAIQDAKETTEMNFETYLIEKYPFEVPQSLIYDEALNRYRKERQRLESINAPEGEKEARLKQYFIQVDKESKEALQLHFLFNNIAEKSGIKVNETDLLNWLMQSGMLTGQEDNFEELKARAYTAVVKNKVFDLIKKNRETKVE